MEGNLSWDFENSSNYRNFEFRKFELKGAFGKSLTRNSDSA